MSEKKPVPIFGASKGKKCPVCGKQSYSKAGIHPQCAETQADASRTEEIKDAQKRQADEPQSTSWNQKVCPRCKATLHVRQKQCQCGHCFF